MDFALARGNPDPNLAGVVSPAWMHLKELRCIRCPLTQSPPDKGEKAPLKGGAAIDFVRASFSHLKAIPVDQGGQMLLKKRLSD